MTGPSPIPAVSPSRGSPLVVVSNRLPFRAERRAAGLHLTRSPGGLVTALEPVLEQRGGVWVGWTGVSREEAEAAGGIPWPERPADRVQYHPVPLSAHELSQYYGGFSNRTLWPLFHYFVGETEIDGLTWEAYDRVNERFAQVAAAASPPGGLVWVHDYHLLRVPHHIRRLTPGLRLAFFLHIPFPAADVFRVLPWSRVLLRGMLAADLVAFHVPSYADHFLTCAERLLGCEVERAPGGGLVRFDGRQVSVQAHPIGIDVAQVERLASETPLPDGNVPEAERVADILGVDRLDYTKGLHERLLAIERLLERYPGYHRRFVFTQVLVPSRERVAAYHQLKRDIDETVGRINGRFAEAGWSPIRYMVRALPPEELVPMYRKADVALVTPLRDGMNLVAKEYVMAQLENDGVLVLSELAGAAEELQEALIVNPFDVEAVAEMLHRALVMPGDERRARMSALRDRVRANDVHVWVQRFLAGAEEASQRAQSTIASPADQVERRLGRWLAQRPTVALFLDYDGTLTPIVARPEDARLSDAARQVLEQAARTPGLDTVVVSGRRLADIQALVGIPGLTYVGNHGFEIEGPGISYRHEAADAFQEPLEAAALELASLGVPGAAVERKGATVAYHVRGVAAPERRRIERRASAILRRRRLRVVAGKCVIEGRPPAAWHKGQAVLYVLNRRHGADWPSRVRVLYIGDDQTDVDAFGSLRGIGRSVGVGDAGWGPALAADFRLPDPDAVLQLLRWLASGAYATGRP